MHTVPAIHIFGPPDAPQAVYECPAEVAPSYCPGQAEPYVLTARIALSHTIEIHLTAPQKAALFRAWRAPKHPQNQPDQEPEPVEREEA